MAALQRFSRALWRMPAQHAHATRSWSRTLAAQTEEVPATRAPTSSSAVLATLAFEQTGELHPGEMGYPGARSAKFTSNLTVLHAVRREAVPAFRVLQEDGRLVPQAVDVGESPHFGREKVLRMYQCMLQLHAMDELLYLAQRQGRISFYMTSTGEEAAVIGAAAALQPGDDVFAQYREQGVLLWRGFSFDEFTNQCFGTASDLGKGRQMPIHYGSAKLAFHTVSSPLATQLPQAAGAAYALKLRHTRNNSSSRQSAHQGLALAAAQTAAATEPVLHDAPPSPREAMNRVVACFFGDGAASEGDFHAALNFAATLQCPVLFLCRNNGFAISTPTHEQYAGDGIVMRGIGYGMDALRVDGNDALAVAEAVRAARQHAAEHRAPVLIEMLTYRKGHHSTSDDSSRYRAKSEIDLYDQRANPISRLRNYLIAKGWWTQAEDKEYLAEQRKRVLDSVKRAESDHRIHPMSLFDDVYDKLPAKLYAQRTELHEHLARYPQVYGAAVDRPPEPQNSQ